MSAHPSVCSSVFLSFFLNDFCSNFMHAWLSSISWIRLKFGFLKLTVSKMANKMAAVQWNSLISNKFLWDPFQCQTFLVFSSPEHEVLMVSFCDRRMSVVCCVSCLAHNFFKHLLLLNHWASLYETWQGCSLGEALPKLSKRLNSSHKSGCQGNQKEKK